MSNVLADHFVFRVDNKTTLDQAIKIWQGYGFQVHFGGQHIGGVTSNALIVFNDGLYLEILAVNEDAKDAEKHRWFNLQPGWIDWAISPKRINLDEVLSKLEGVDESVKYGPATPGGRDTSGPASKHLEWETAIPQGKVGRLPFFCADVTPRDWRVRADTSEQPNQFTGVNQIVLLTNDLKAYSQSLAVLFGPPHAHTDSSAIFTTTSPTGGTVQILAREAEGTVELEWMDTHGEGFCRLVLDTDGDERDIPELGISWRKRQT